MTWLTPIRDALDEERPVLVLCRSSATKREVLRRFAALARPGVAIAWSDLQVMTLGGFLESLELDRSTTDSSATEVCPPLPEGHPWQARLAERPKLRRRLFRRMAPVYEARLLGREGALSEPIEQLLEADWGRPDHLALAKRLLSGGLVFDPELQRFAIGFSEDSGLTPMELALVDAIGCRRIPEERSGAPPPSARDEGLLACAVTDVAAEARTVANRCLASFQAGIKAEEIVVLTAGSQTAQRIRAACRRNGVPVADDAPVPLTRHGLCSVLRPLLPLFEARGAGLLHVRDLHRLFSHPSLSRRAPKNAALLLPTDVDADDKPRIELRSVRGFLRECRLSRAGLDDWDRALIRQEEPLVTLYREADGRGRDAARRRLVSLAILRARLARLATHARSGRGLGALGALLDDLRLRDPRDGLGIAIRSALGRAAARPATEAHFEDALDQAGSTGRVESGVQLLSIDGWDGRPAKRLMIVDVHGQGLAKVPARDPFLCDADAGVLGLESPVEVVRRRLRVLGEAVRSADKALAIVTQNDAGGRAVSPPVGLTLRYEVVPTGLEDQNFGLELEGYERSAREALKEGEGDTADPSARQVDLEWFRAGWIFHDPVQVPALEPKTTPLPEFLRRDLGWFPEDLRPWLGWLGEGEGLPDGFKLSASRLGHLTSCLYQGFANSRLRLRPREEIEEELNAREVGSAVHKAFERATLGISLRVPTAELEAARQTLDERLETEFDRAAEEALAGLPGIRANAALAVAREGFVRRWRVAWRHYVEQRIRSVEEHNAELRGPVLEKDILRPIFKGERALPGPPESGLHLIPGLPDYHRKTFVAAFAEALREADFDVEAVVQSRARWIGSTSKLARGGLAPFVAEPVFEAGLRALAELARQEVQSRLLDLSGDLTVVKTELAFGEVPDRAATELQLQLGREAVSVRGFIDAIKRLRGAVDTATARYDIVDYKTGKSPFNDSDRMNSRLTAPQLILYALALQELGVIEDDEPAPIEVLSLVYDVVRQPKLSEWPGHPELLERAAGAFGELLDHARDGRWPLRPQPAECPALGGKGYCDYKDACRIRQGFGQSIREDFSEATG